MSFLWRKKVELDWKFMTLDELEVEMGGDEYWMHSWSKMWVFPELFGAYVFL